MLLSPLSVFWWTVLRSAASFLRELTWAWVTGLKGLLGVLGGVGTFFNPSRPEGLTGVKVLNGLESVRLLTEVVRGLAAVPGDWDDDFKLRLDSFLRTDEMDTGRGLWLTVLGSACTFLTLWKGRMAGMQWVPEVFPFNEARELLESIGFWKVTGGLGVLDPLDTGLPCRGASELTLTWSLLVPKLLTEGFWCRFMFGVGIFNPNLPSSLDKVGWVNATVVIGACEICAAACAALTMFAA